VIFGGFCGVSCLCFFTFQKNPRWIQHPKRISLSPSPRASGSAPWGRGWAPAVRSPGGWRRLPGHRRLRGREGKMPAGRLEFQTRVFQTAKGGRPSIHRPNHPPMGRGIPPPTGEGHGRARSTSLKRGHFQKYAPSAALMSGANDTLRDRQTIVL